MKITLCINFKGGTMSHWKRKRIALPQQAVGLMIACLSIDEFIQKLEQVNNLLADSVFKQALSYAKSSKDLHKTRMIKTPVISSPCFSQQADITPSFARTIQGVMRNATALAQSGSQQDLGSAIDGLKKLKKQQDKKNSEKVKALLNANCELYAFSSSGTLSQLATELKQAIPQKGSPFTACILFIGQDLTNIRGLINAI